MCQVHTYAVVLHAVHLTILVPRPKPTFHPGEAKTTQIVYPYQPEIIDRDKRAEPLKGLCPSHPVLFVL